MKRIYNLTKQEIHLEGFGVIEVAEELNGDWKVDLFPRNSLNDHSKLLLEQNFDSTGDKYFAYTKPKTRQKID